VEMEVGPARRLGTAQAKDRELGHLSRWSFADEQNSADQLRVRRITPRNLLKLRH
jgi:hypothetical protein